MHQLSNLNRYFSPIVRVSRLWSPFCLTRWQHAWIGSCCWAGATRWHNASSGLRQQKFREEWSQLWYNRTGGHWLWLRRHSTLDHTCWSITVRFILTMQHWRSCKGGKMVRWAETVAELELEIQYKLSRKQPHADAYQGLQVTMTYSLIWMWLLLWWGAAQEQPRITWK